MNRYLRIALIVAVVALILYGASFFSNIIFYVLLAALISVIGRPIMRFFERLRIGKFHVPVSLAAIITILFFYGVITAFAYTFLPMIVKQVNVLTGIDYAQVSESLQEPISKVDSFLQRYKLAEQDKSTTDYVTESLAKYFNVSKMTNWANSIFSTLGDILTALFAVSFISFFFLTDRTLLYNFTLNLVPDKFLHQYDNVVNSIKYMLSRYVFGIIIQVTIVTILLWIGLSIIGVDNALLIAFFGGVVNIIPYVGPPIGAAFGMFVAITFNLDLGFYDGLLPMILKIAAVFATVQIIDNIIIQPYVFSNSVNAHPLEIFLVILIAGTLAGIPGMIFAIPSYVILRVIGKEFLSEFKLVQALTKNV